MTYSTNFRKKVLSIKQQYQLTFSETAERFGVSQASVVRWSRNIKPKRTRNKPTVKLNWEALAQDVDEHPDSYQYERAALWGVSRQGIAYALKPLKLSRKKTTFQPPKANPEAPAVFQAQIANYHQMNQTIVYVDESSFAHDMPRRQGYSPIGKRCFGRQNWGAKGRTNVIGA